MGPSLIPSLDPQLGSMTRWNRPSRRGAGGGGLLQQVKANPTVLQLEKRRGEGRPLPFLCVMGAFSFESHPLLCRRTLMFWRKKKSGCSTVGPSKVFFYFCFYLFIYCFVCLFIHCFWGFFLFFNCTFSAKAASSPRGYQVEGFLGVWASNPVLCPVNERQRSHAKQHSLPAQVAIEWREVSYAWPLTLTTSQVIDVAIETHLNNISHVNKNVVITLGMRYCFQWLL